MSPPDTSDKSEQRQSGDSGSDSCLAHQGNDKEDHGPRYVDMALPVAAHVYQVR